VSESNKYLEYSGSSLLSIYTLSAVCIHWDKLNRQRGPVHMFSMPFGFWKVYFLKGVCWSRWHGEAVKPL